MSVRIGTITIGQSPRDDILQDITPLLNGVEVIHAGALDRLSKDEIAQLAPAGDMPLITRLSDGKSAVVGKKKITRNIELCIEKLTDNNVDAIIMLCTGEFSSDFTSSVPIIYPDVVLSRLVPLLGKHAIVVYPEKNQLQHSKERWSGILKTSHIYFNPYDALQDTDALFSKLKEMPGDIIVLDCIGYSDNIKEMIYRNTNKRVVLPRTLVFKIVLDLIGHH